MALTRNINFKNGVEANRLAYTPKVAEPLWITDDKTLFIGDGVTAGGIAIAMASSIVTVNDTLISTSPTEALSAKQGKALKDSIDALGANDHLVSASFDNATNTLTFTESDGGTSTVVIPDDKVLLVDDLTTGGTTTALTAEQGKVLKGLIDGLTLNSMSDINAPTPSANDVLSWDAGTSKWVNKPQAVTSVNGKVGAVVIKSSDLDDVDTTPATAGQVMTWDGGINKWKAVAIPSGVTTFTALDDTQVLSAGVANQMVIVNPAGDGLVYTDTIDGGTF